MQLFIAFFKLGLVSFGGGYAMIPLIEHEAMRHGWVQSTSEFTDVIAIAGMSPGPIATNSAVIIGYQQAGLIGAIVAVVASSLPSFLVIGLLLTVFRSLRKHPLFASAFAGVRPVVVALIVYAAFRFALSNQMVSSWNWHAIGGIAICAGSLIALQRYRVHPMTVLLLSAITGVALYG